MTLPRSSPTMIQVMYFKLWAAIQLLLEVKIIVQFPSSVIGGKGAPPLK